MSDHLSAGRVGRAHGLDGSFVVTWPRPALLVLGASLRVGDRDHEIVRRAGTDEKPIVRLDGIDSREAADAVPWTRPIDLVHTSGQPLPRLGGRFYGESGLGGVYYLCALFADGSARYFTEHDEETIRALISWKR